MQTTPVLPHLPSIRIVGLSTAVASGLMVLVNLVSLVTTSAIDAMNKTFDSPVFSQYIPQSMKSMLDLYTYSRWWTWYGILFFAFALAAGVQFSRRRSWGRMALEVACWIAIANAFVDSYLSYQIWSGMQDAFNSVLSAAGGGRTVYLNPLGFFTIVIGFFLWILPAAGLIFYLRRPVIKQAVNL